MKHNAITRRAFLLSSLALLACLVCGVLVWKGFGKSLSDHTANWPQNADAATENAGYHYLGCAKTFAQMGKAFAEAILNLKK